MGVRRYNDPVDAAIKIEGKHFKIVDNPKARHVYKVLTLLHTKVKLLHERTLSSFFREFYDKLNDLKYAKKRETIISVLVELCLSSRRRRLAPGRIKAPIPGKAPVPGRKAPIPGKAPVPGKRGKTSGTSVSNPSEEMFKKIKKKLDDYRDEDRAKIISMLERLGSRRRRLVAAPIPGKAPIPVKKRTVMSGKKKAPKPGKGPAPVPGKKKAPVPGKKKAPVPGKKAPVPGKASAPC